MYGEAVVKIWRSNIKYFLRYDVPRAKYLKSHKLRKTRFYPKNVNLGYFCFKKPPNIWKINLLV